MPRVKARRASQLCSRGKAPDSGHGMIVHVDERADGRQQHRQFVLPPTRQRLSGRPEDLLLLLQMLLSNVTPNALQPSWMPLLLSHMVRLHWLAMHTSSRVTPATRGPEAPRFEAASHTCCPACQTCCPAPCCCRLIRCPARSHPFKALLHSLCNLVSHGPALEPFKQQHDAAMYTSQVLLHQRRTTAPLLQGRGAVVGWRLELVELHAP